MNARTISRCFCITGIGHKEDPPVATNGTGVLEVILEKQELLKEDKAALPELDEKTKISEVKWVTEQKLETVDELMIEFKICLSNTWYSETIMIFWMCAEVPSDCIEKQYSVGVKLKQNIS